MELTALTFIIVCPLLFLAGLVDSIGGGGGLISIPAYMLAGLPAHSAIATNKLSSSMGTALATFRFIKNGLVNFRLAIPAVIFAVIGSTIGAHVSLMVDEEVLRIMLTVLLPLIAFVVLNKKIFHDNDEELFVLDIHAYITAIICALTIGFYDGFYGPGTGTFLIIGFTIFSKMSMKSANAQAKVINLTTNISSLVVFLVNGQVLIYLGLAAAVCNMAGNYIGSGLVMKDSGKIVKPIIVLVLVLLFLKLLGVIPA